MSIIIAIDGPAASGKGTLAKRLAETLNFAHLDTGAVYRLVSKHILDNNFEITSENAIKSALFVQENITLASLDDPSLRNDVVGGITSKISAIPEVREILKDIQRDFAHKPPKPYKGAVLDGRDIGTIICPDANVKLYVTASAETRAQRRLKELQLRGFSVTYDTVLQDMKERDFRDTNRETAPLKPAEDAIHLDTSSMTQEDALKEALSIVHKKAGI